MYLRWPRSKGQGSHGEIVMKRERRKEDERKQGKKKRRGRTPDEVFETREKQEHPLTSRDLSRSQDVCVGSVR